MYRIGGTLNNSIWKVLKSQLEHNMFILFPSSIIIVIFNNKFRSSKFWSKTEKFHFKMIQDACFFKQEYFYCPHIINFFRDGVKIYQQTHFLSNKLILCNNISINGFYLTKKSNHFKFEFLLCFKWTRTRMAFQLNKVCWRHDSA